MKHISSLIDKSKLEQKDAHLTERGEIFRKFLDTLNPSRKKMGLRPLSFSRVAKIFEGVPTSDLYYVDSVCTKADNYSKMFWWLTKNAPKKTENPPVGESSK